MTCGPVAILVLTNKEDTYLDENGIKTYYDSPVQRWKEMIGDKDPNVAKGDENALRGIYGNDLIHNGFWGSDNASDAYRELSMFMLPLPSIPPKFVYDENLIKLKTIINFLLPPKPDHPDISGRLDLIGKYGPITEYHILDICLCTDCRKKIKDILKKKGVNMKKATDKILKEEFINENINSFCEKCKTHFNKWTHLITGFEGTHIATNEEISNMANEMNENDLLFKCVIDPTKNQIICITNLEQQKVYLNSGDKITLPYPFPQVEGITWDYPSFVTMIYRRVITIGDLITKINKIYNGQCLLSDTTDNYYSFMLNLNILGGNLFGENSSKNAIGVSFMQNITMPFILGKLHLLGKNIDNYYSHAFYKTAFCYPLEDIKNTNYEKEEGFNFKCNIPLVIIFMLKLPMIRRKQILIIYLFISLQKKILL